MQIKMVVIRIYDMTPLLTVERLQGTARSKRPNLINTIQCVVEPDSWEALGGMGTIQSMIVNNRCLVDHFGSSDVHMQVQSLLDQMAISGRLKAYPTQTFHRNERSDCCCVVSSR